MTTETQRPLRHEALTEAARGLAVLDALGCVDATITYADFANSIGYPPELPLNGWQLAQVLFLIRLTPGGESLTKKVVRADTGLPGSGDEWTPALTVTHIGA